MRKVFISYAREDLAPTQKLYKKLKSIAGIDLWFDKESLPAGVRWEPAIRRSIRESSIFLALLSQHSVTKRGFVQKETKLALDVADELPEGETFIIPLRLEECEIPDRLREFHCVDMFPNWRQGFEQLVRGINSAPVANGKASSNLLTGYEYRCAVVDFDNGLTNLPQICQRLNSIQNFFHFTHPNIPLKKKPLRRLDGSPNLDIPALPKSFYEQEEYLNADLVVCLSQYLLTFEEDQYILSNYLSGPSSVKDTFLFISTNQLYEATKQARCTFEKGMFYNILSQLIVFFATDLEFHDEVRGCILDYCEDRFVMIKGLRAMRLCPKCSAKIKNAELMNAVKAILADELQV